MMIKQLMFVFSFVSLVALIWLSLLGMLPAGWPERLGALVVFLLMLLLTGEFGQAEAEEKKGGDDKNVPAQ